MAGLGDIVVRPELESHDALHVVAPGGQHDDGHAPEGSILPSGAARPPDAAQHLQAVESRQHDVEDQQIDRASPEGRQGTRSVVDRVHLHAFSPEVLPEELAQGLVVVGEQDAGSGLGDVHGRGW